MQDHMTTEAQIRVAEADRREMDEKIATEIMGWRQGRAERGQYPWRTPDDRPQLGVPSYTTDAAADYEVLEHVRAAWDHGAQYHFSRALLDLWQPRNRGDYAFPPIMRYRVGDYSRAALAAMEGE